jgi:tetratricopeptide (TPR) repeat protein
MTARKRTSGHWVRFSYTDADYEYAGAALAKHWERLHRGDREPFPDAKRVASLPHGKGRAGGATASATAAQAAEQIQSAWRAFHRGEFEAAWLAGPALGPLGACAALKAACVYASYLEDDTARAQRILLDAVDLAQRTAEQAPEHANAHYLLAFALGRYSQRISVLKALAAGHATRIRASLERALALDPAHADAHIALGLYHAEIVGKVGGLAARVTYGASADAAKRHFERAIQLFPEAAIAKMEYANGLLAMRGDAARAQAAKLYEAAAACQPADAMERLDVEQAKAELA